MLRSFIALCLGCTCLLGGLLGAPTVGVAYAQAPSIRSQLPPEAQKDWDAAKDLFSIGDYKGAVIQYTRAYERSQNPRVLFNIGVSEKNLKHYANAVAAWKKELEFKDKLTPDEITELEENIKAVSSFVSTLRVTANEEGAMLSINNEEIGTTPFSKPIPIDVGQQEVSLRKPGFIEKKVTVNVSRTDEASVDFKLEPAQKTSTVTINVTGANGAKIFIDGVDMGTAPFKGRIEAGRHTFEARIAGFETARQTSEVVYNEAMSLTLALVKSRNEGKVRITTNFTDATIRIDGRVVGTGAWEGVLDAGGHALVVEKDGYETRSTDIALEKDQVRSLQISLVKDTGSTWVWWALGTAAVVAGAGVTSFFVLQPATEPQVSGSLNNGVDLTRF